MPVLLLAAVDSLRRQNVDLVVRAVEPIEREARGRIGREPACHGSADGARGVGDRCARARECEQPADREDATQGLIHFESDNRLTRVFRALSRGGRARSDRCWRRLYPRC